MKALMTGQPLTSEFVAQSYKISSFLWNFTLSRAILKYFSVTRHIKSETLNQHKSETLPSIHPFLSNFEE